MRVLKIILFFLTIPSLGLLLWMNLTPGYFQLKNCKLGYYTNEEVRKSKELTFYESPPLDCRPNPLVIVFIYLARLDFNKGDMTNGGASVPGAGVESPATPTAEDYVSDSPLGRKRYTSNKYGFSFEYPSEIKLEKPSETTVKATFLGDQDKKGAAFQLSDGYQFFVSVFNTGNETLASLTSKMSQNEKSDCIKGGEFFARYKLNKNTYSINVSKWPNDVCGIFVSNEKYIYVISRVITGSTPNRIKYMEATDKILLSIRLQDVVDQQSYTCPKTMYVDCMPGPEPANPDPVKAICQQKKYLDWAVDNCPGFKGTAF